MNWGLGGGKYLFVMFDEKWMWGLVVRRYAKSCEKLGLKKKYYKAYHRNHIIQPSRPLLLMIILKMVVKLSNLVCSGHRVLKLQTKK